LLRHKCQIVGRDGASELSPLVRELRSDDDHHLRVSRKQLDRRIGALDLSGSVSTLGALFRFGGRMHRARLFWVVFVAAVGVACDDGPPPPVTRPPMPEKVQPASGAPAAPPMAAAAGGRTQSTTPATPAMPAGGAAGEAAREFKLPPLAAGYQRYETAPIDVAVGQSDDWAQWVGGPLDQDYDIIDITGAQSVGGHHALVYATVDAQPAGFTRFWKDEDQISTRLMGGLGGEGGASVNLPPGIVFRAKRGSYIVVQTHYLNASDRPIVGRTVIDMKLAPVDPSRRVASIMSMTSVSIDLAPHVETKIDIRCEVMRDLQFLQISNHMHEYGTTTFTEFVDPAGAAHMLKKDERWSGEWALNPNFTEFAVETPGLVPKGSTLHTQCAWNNTTEANVKFPAEMCVFFGFILSETDIYCTDGKWSEATSTSQPAGGAAGAAAGASGASGAPAIGAAGGAAPAAVGCSGTSDQTIMHAVEFEQQTTDCAIGCAFDPDVAGCTAPCFEGLGLSHACAACNAANIACGSSKCRDVCLLDSEGEPCRSCVMTNCEPAFQMCKGDASP
jgi:hypothetical protein